MAIVYMDNKTRLALIQAVDSPIAMGILLKIHCHLTLSLFNFLLDLESSLLELCLPTSAAATTILAASVIRTILRFSISGINPDTS